MVSGGKYPSQLSLLPARIGGQHTAIDHAVNQACGLGQLLSQCGAGAVELVGIDSLGDGLTNAVGLGLIDGDAQ